MRKLIAGNWKMHGLKQEGLALAKALSDKLTQQNAAFDMLICPPATLIDSVASTIDNNALLLGGQDCHSEQTGAYTGNIAAPMLKDLSCQYVLVGHSERRQLQKEDNALIKAKATAGLSAGLIVVLCVGETLDQREAGLAEKTVAEQINGSLPDDANADTLVIAYEPVWAIGTGRTASAKDIADMHKFIAGQVASLAVNDRPVRLLYGGSVKPDNAREILSTPHVDGVLVGGASLDADSFWQIACASPLAVAA